MVRVCERTFHWSSHEKVKRIEFEDKVCWWIERKDGQYDRKQKAKQVYSRDYEGNIEI